MYSNIICHRKAWLTHWKSYGLAIISLRNWRVSMCCGSFVFFTLVTIKSKIGSNSLDYKRCRAWKIFCLWAIRCMKISPMNWAIGWKWLKGFQRWKNWMVSLLLAMWIQCWHKWQILHNPLLFHTFEVSNLVQWYTHFKNMKQNTTKIFDVLKMYLKMRLNIIKINEVHHVNSNWKVI